MEHPTKSLPELLEVKHVAQICGVTALAYRRTFLRRADHPKPVFPDMKPMRFRKRDVYAWLQLGDD